MFINEIVELAINICLLATFLMKKGKESKTRGDQKYIGSRNLDTSYKKLDIDFSGRKRKKKKKSR